jgi:hypothetical protein
MASLVRFAVLMDSDLLKGIDRFLSRSENVKERSSLELRSSYPDG